jgi:hypothetical protein
MDAMHYSVIAMYILVWNIEFLKPPHPAHHSTQITTFPLMPTKPSPHSSLIKAHKHCINNKSLLKKDDLCGCFYCLKIFNPNEITEWINDKSEITATCPHCGIDSVIG